MEWKTATIRLLLKKLGLTLVHSNYWPGSNLPFLSKVVEKVVLPQFRKHCDNHRMIPDYQSAYCANYSCETALLKIMNDILWAMERQDITALIAIDLSAAFSTVNHNILIEVLHRRFGVTETALEWFTSYLRPQFCRVNVNNFYSFVLCMAVRSNQLFFNVSRGNYTAYDCVYCNTQLLVFRFSFLCIT